MHTLVWKFESNNNAKLPNLKKGYFVSSVCGTCGDEGQGQGQGLREMQST